MNEPSVLYEMAKTAVRDSYRWFGHAPASQDLSNKVLCLAGEVGEVANLVKKCVRGDFTLREKTPELREEIADVFTYLLDIAGILEMDLIEEYNRKRAINEERFSTRKDTSA